MELKPASDSSNVRREASEPLVGRQITRNGIMNRLRFFSKQSLSLRDCREKD